MNAGKSGFKGYISKLLQPDIGIYFLDDDPIYMTIVGFSVTGRVKNEIESFFLAAMMEGGLAFNLYDALYPSPSDPGAYLSYRPSGGTWKMTLGNHGWSGGIYEIEPATICRQLKHLHDKGLLTGLRLDGVCFFSHYALESPEKSRAMNERLCQIHG